MERILSIMALVLLLAACGSSDSPSPSDSRRSASETPTPSEPEEPTPPPVPQDRLDVMLSEVEVLAQTLADLQDNPSATDPSLTGTWVEVWGIVANGTFVDSNGEYDYELESRGFNVYSVQQSANTLNMTKCYGSEPISVGITPPVGGVTTFNYVDGSRNATIERNKVIVFQEQIVRNGSITDTDYQGGLKLARWVKVDSSALGNVGFLQRNSVDMDISCGSALQEHRKYFDDFEENINKMTLTTSTGAVFRNDGAHYSDGFTNGDPDFTRNDNVYSVELDSINSLFTIQ